MQKMFMTFSWTEPKIKRRSRRSFGRTRRIKRPVCAGIYPVKGKICDGGGAGRSGSGIPSEESAAGHGCAGLADLAGRAVGPETI